MPRHPQALGRSQGLLLVLSCLFLGACNGLEYVAKEVPDSGATSDALVPDAAGASPMAPPNNPFAPGAHDPINCTKEAAARYQWQLLAFASVNLDCVLPFDPNADVDFHGPLPASGPPKENIALVCQAQPLFAWFDPPLPLPPKRIVYCRGACEIARGLLGCLLLANPCHPLDDQDSGVTVGCARE